MVSSEFDSLPDSVLKSPIEVLNLTSIRAINALCRVGIKTVGELLQEYDGDFRGLRSVGEKTSAEIENALHTLLKQIEIEGCVLKSDASTGESGEIFVSEVHPPELVDQEQVDLANIPAGVRDLSLSLLHFSKVTQNVLEEANITTVGQFLELGGPTLASVRGLGPRGQKSIRARLQALLSSIEGEDVQWPIFCERLNIRLIPQKSDESSGQEVLVNLPQVIREILEQRSDKRLWTVIQRRFGLEGTTSLTLQELGIAFGLTRERIRQLEVRALQELHEVLVKEEYTSKLYHVQPQFSRHVHLLSQIALGETQNAVRESVLLKRIEEHFAIDPEPVQPSLFFVLRLSGIERMAFRKDDLEPIWGILARVQQRKIQSGVERLDALLTEEFATPLNEVDILIHLNKGTRPKRRFALEELKSLIELCSSVEKCSEGFFWGKFEHLVGRFNQVERILLEHGEPVPLNEITRTINHRMVKAGKRPVDSRNLANQIGGDSRFVPIGRSSEWGLSSWSLHTDTVVDLMKQCLMVRNEPATAEEIYGYVSERRPVRRSSIDAYLTFLDDFAKIDRTHWGLATWDEAGKAKTWNPAQVAGFVERIFRKTRSKKIEYKIIRQALMEEADISPRQAQGFLNFNPVITTERDMDTGELYATFQPNYTEKLERKVQAKNTLRQQVRETVREILESAPGQQIALSELVASLAKSYGRSQQTFYSYISSIEFVEKFTVPETRRKMCRLLIEDRDDTTPFEQVESITSQEMRNNVSRALSFLDINNVDIALFLLSKEFEAALRTYLELAHARGKLLDVPKSLNLSVMVDFIEKQGIITDKAVLHFLRQKRNERAHGTAPSLEERRIMMKYAETTAGMYIDYMKFFDDLSHQLV